MLCYIKDILICINKKSVLNLCVSLLSYNLLLSVSIICIITGVSTAALAFIFNTVLILLTEFTIRKLKADF